MKPAQGPGPPPKPCFKQGRDDPAVIMLYHASWLLSTKALDFFRSPLLPIHRKHQLCHMAAPGTRKHKPEATPASRPRISQPTSDRHRAGRRARQRLAKRQLRLERFAPNLPRSRPHSRASCAWGLPKPSIPICQELTDGGWPRHRATARWCSVITTLAYLRWAGLRCV